MFEIQQVTSRIWTDPVFRPSGPFAFRLLLQPLAAAILASQQAALKPESRGRIP